MARKKKFYQGTPTAPAKTITTKSLAPKQQASLGNATPKQVPKTPGVSSAFGGVAHAPVKRHEGVGSTPGIGVVRRLGTLKASGHPKAHRIGGR